ncbi:hypothetical protein ABIB40_004152 [Pedobacter sp. UYP30]|uniref:HNH endonuclease n=1 Tax=Pedobacter sp. UYP30 TaxID=1756400 RepID=UPI0033948146
MQCIFCETSVVQNSIEHIVPESLGNKSYILQIGAICRSCNNSFSKFEEKALGKSMLGFERARLGIVTKKGRPAKASSNGIKFEGDSKFEKNRVTVYGINDKNTESINEDGSFNVKIQDFDKSEMSTCKLLLKIGLESLYNSQRKIYKKYDFSELKNHLTSKTAKDWPLLTPKILPSNFISIPRFNDRYNLNKIKCELKLLEVNPQTILFHFQYSVVSYIVNLVDRNIVWTKEFLEKDELANLYPERLKKI